MWAVSSEYDLTRNADVIKVRTEMRSWIMVGPLSTSVLKRDRKQSRDTQRRPGAAMAGHARSHREREEARKNPYPGSLEGVWPSQHLGLGFLASTAGKGHISVLSHRAAVIGFGSLKQRCRASCLLQPLPPVLHDSHSPVIVRNQSLAILNCKEKNLNSSQGRRGNDCGKRFVKCVDIA